MSVSTFNKIYPNGSKQLLQCEQKQPPALPLPFSLSPASHPTPYANESMTSLLKERAVIGRWEESLLLADGPSPLDSPSV